MRKKARVILIRRSIGMFAAETSTGSVSVFETLASEPVETGDILSGELDALGIQRVYNESSDIECRVFVHDRNLTVSEAVERHFAESSIKRRPMWPLRIVQTSDSESLVRN